MKQHPKNFQTQVSQQNEQDFGTKTKQYNCMECDHQTTEKFKLRKHIKLAHQATTSELQFKCRDCAQEFERMWSLRNHRRDSHGKSKKKCGNKADNLCKFGANDGEECWYDHTDSIQNADNSACQDYKCKNCEDKFSSKSQLLTHRKEKHQETVPECYSVKENRLCQYSDKCRFRHEALSSHIAPDHENSDKPKKDRPMLKSFFWKTPNPIKPPNQMEEIKNMIQNMTKEIGDLKAKVQG